jgi:hypothetical protein
VLYAVIVMLLFTGEEMASDEELPYFLMPDDLSGRQRIPHEAMPKVFKGSLKDYQGLEGVRSRF